MLVPLALLFVTAQYSFQNLKVEAKDNVNVSINGSNWTRLGEEVHAGNRSLHLPAELSEAGIHGHEAGNSSRSRRDSAADVKQKRKNAFRRTNPEDSPWAVLVVFPNSPQNWKQMMIAGTIVKLDWVVSSSRFTLDRSYAKSKHRRLTVFAGAGKVMSEVDASRNSQVREVEDIYFPPDNRKTAEKYFYMLSFLKVSPPFQQTKFVKPIAVMDATWGSQGKSWCSVTGFSVVQKGEKWPEDYHRKAYSVQIENCPCPYSDRADPKYGGPLCNVGATGYGPCKGDQGAGLVCNGKLLGVLTSFHKTQGKSCKVLSPEETTTCGYSDTRYIFIPTSHIRRLLSAAKISVSQVRTSAASRNTCSFPPIAVVSGIFLIQLVH